VTTSDRITADVASATIGHRADPCRLHRIYVGRPRLFANFTERALSFDARTADCFRMTPAPIRSLSAPLRHLLALAACALTAAVAWPLHGTLDLANTVMLFLLTVVLVAAFLGRTQAILASFASVALFDFFFVPPQISFAVSDAQYLVTFAVMLAVALFISHLTAGLKSGTDEAIARERRTRALYSLAKALAGSVAPAQVVEETVKFIAQHAGGQAMFLLPGDHETLQVFSIDGGPSAAALTMTEQLSASAVFHSRETIASREIGASDGLRLLLPLAGSTRCRGVLHVTAHSSRHTPTDPPATLDRPLLEAVASLAAIALERVHFVEVAQCSQLETQSERLRSSLLSAISHDIRTPLTALYGLADSLAGTTSALPESERETARAIRDQAMHLHGMVTNLLDMARLQAGKMPLRLEWQPIEEVIGASIRAVGLTLRGNPVRVELAPDLPLVAIDAVLMERVLCNLLENAAKFSPPGAEITIAAATEQHWLALSVSDRGSGFPPGSLPRVFDLFERGARESPVAGVGLGLAISRAIVEAHAGSIDASNRDGGGACVRIRLPTGGAPDIEPEAGDGPEAGPA